MIKKIILGIVALFWGSFAVAMLFDTVSKENFYFFSPVNLSQFLLSFSFMIISLVSFALLKRKQKNNLLAETFIIIASLFTVVVVFSLVFSFIIRNLIPEF